MVALLVIGIRQGLRYIIFHVEKPKTPGYAVEVEQVANSSPYLLHEAVEVKG